MKEVVRLSIRNILFQRFIMPRGRMRWFGHFLLATGCLISFAVTFGLTFGWMHFTLKEGTIDMYETHLLGFTVMTFPLNTVMATYPFPHFGLDGDYGHRRLFNYDAQKVCR
jgi:hypothetical protein